MIGSSLSLVIAQRLVSRNCQSCLVVEEIKPDMLKLLKTEFGTETPENFLKEAKQHRGKGCKVCNNEGFHGRIGIFEVLDISEKIKELIYTKAPVNEIEAEAKREGFSRMFIDGLAKVQAGQTTIEEVFGRSETNAG